jgi:hypothetical protein
MLHSSTRSLLWLAAAVLVPCLAATSAFAQYQYVPSGGPPGYGGPPGGYAPPGYGYPPYGGGYWNGSAAALDAYANFGVSTEQARILREQSNQAKLVTKKQTIDTMAYERANKYWYTDEKIDIQAKKIQYALNNPPSQEITSGRMLNTLLPYLDQIATSPNPGPSIPVDHSVIKALNVTAGADLGNVGMLKDVGSLEWPTSLEGETQKSLDSMLQQAVSDAMSGTVKPAAISKLNKATDKLEQEVKGKLHKSEIDGGEYLEGTRFIARIRESITALKQPTAAKFLTGDFGPRGDTVDEIVLSMSSKGLTFAPSQPGQEFAYIALHRAFTTYAVAAGVPDTGFRVMVRGGSGLFAPQKN